MGLITAGQPITAAILNRQYTLGDSNNNAVTQTALTTLNTAYTIPASDAAAFTTYRQTSWGFGTWGSTQQALTFAIALAGTDIGNQPAIASTAFSASAAFRWEITLTLKCTSTGASGTWSASLRGILTQSTNAILPGTAADNSVPFTANTNADVTQDTTVGVSLAIQAKWAATTGAPTITCTDTVMERLAV